MRFFSLTTWSLHRNLGPLRWTRWDGAGAKHYTETQEQPELLSLPELPAALAEKGYEAANVCHFHIPDVGEEYARRLRGSFETAGVRLFTLLLDYGDISSADDVRREADLAWLKRWIDFAAAAGAERVRVVAGESAPDDARALERSAEGLRELCDYAEPRGVRVVTENFRPLTSTADNCLALLEACGDRLGLIADFGNFGGPGKLEELSRIAPRAEEIHAKAKTDAEGFPDADELRSCLDLVRDADFAGPITLVYDGPGDMWAGIERVRSIVAPYVAD
ncbi:sugar phosphate isomerase/epimerase [Paenibacillus antri]|uniref:Sugar phosphate isomerase/epimerase n=1 Tax=Paenibacillus antri TaxID=2582848 RepID=A0A5R9GHL9_9BACL|nr:sugar phosphate isomerase/epimerase family protein [Paenibacillus antri]TLS53966.1 sugar phosphate isomerase/epimerase [Paenibacillus antri]